MNNNESDDYSNLVGEVDTSPDEDWETDPRIKPSENFQYIGSKALAVPWDFSSDLERNVDEGPYLWTGEDIQGDIVLRPDVLERSPADLSGLEKYSLENELKVPVRFQQYDEPGQPYIGFLKTGDIDEEVEIETTQTGLQKLNLGKKYEVSILPENYQRKFT